MSLSTIGLSPIGESHSEGQLNHSDRPNQKKLMKAAEDFEALFLRQLLKEMRSTVPKSGLLDEGTDGEIYREMFDSAIADEMAKAGGIGLSNLIYREFGGNPSSLPSGTGILPVVPAQAGKNPLPK